MKKRMGLIALFLGLAAFVVALVFLYREADRPVEKLPLSISVVLYGDDANRWHSLDQGIAQACSELNIERPIISYSSADDAGRQAVLLRRELEAGADGLLVAATDDVAIGAFLSNWEPQPPLVMVESGGGDFPLVSANDANMARMLADQCVADYDKIAVIYDGRARECVRLRQDAFIARMEAMGEEPLLLVRSEGQEDFQSFLASTLAARQDVIDCVVALDAVTLESAIDALPAAMVDVALCGIGGGSKVVNALDNGQVELLVFPNDYAVGYLAMMQLAQQLGVSKGAATAEIEYRLITRENIYLPDVERLLFPLQQ